MYISGNAKEGIIANYYNDSFVKNINDNKNNNIICYLNG